MSFDSKTNDPTQTRIWSTKQAIDLMNFQMDPSTHFSDEQHVILFKQWLMFKYPLAHLPTNRLQIFKKIGLISIVDGEYIYI